LHPLRKNIIAAKADLATIAVQIIVTAAAAAAVIETATAGQIVGAAN
jgi:hypothetical protein